MILLSLNLFFMRLISPSYRLVLENLFILFIETPVQPPPPSLSNSDMFLFCIILQKQVLKLASPTLLFFNLTIDESTEKLSTFTLKSNQICINITDVLEGIITSLTFGPDNKGSYLCNFKLSFSQENSISQLF